MANKEHNIYRKERQRTCNNDSIKARAFALCLGGLENPRLLLNMTSQLPAGIGNEHDVVGRYFLEHPHAPVGRVVMRKPMTHMLVYSPTPDFMRDNRVLNFGVRIGDMGSFGVAAEITASMA